MTPAKLINLDNLLLLAALSTLVLSGVLLGIAIATPRWTPGYPDDEPVTFIVDGEERTSWMGIPFDRFHIMMMIHDPHPEGSVVKLILVETHQGWWMFDACWGPHGGFRLPNTEPIVWVIASLVPPPSFPVETITGPSGVVDPADAWADLDGDGDLDLQDYVLYLRPIESMKSIADDRLGCPYLGPCCRNSCD